MLSRGRIRQRALASPPIVAGVACAASVAIGLLAGAQASVAQSTPLPPGFVKTEAFSGLTEPSVIRFAPNGRVYVAEKSGIIKTFDSLSDPTPTVFADLRTKVHNFWDRGLLGMSLDSNFGSYPFVYVLYAHDAAIGGTAPRWGTAGATSDPCPNPPGATSDGCVVSGRLSRLKSATGEVMSQENVLVEDWCQQYPSHSTGALEHDAGGKLWASAGDGASFTFTDYGQKGNPKNPCGDPPAGTGGTQTSPTAEGGALRSQDVRTGADPTGLDGTVIRVAPNTGAGTPKNPLYGSSSANERRIVAYGLRNPFRFALPRHLTEMYVGDVGWNEWEEINRFGLNSGLFNFGWPCYEGNGRQGGYDAANLNLCESLYGSGGQTQPLFAYNHASQAAPSDGCPTGSSSIAGLEFYYGSDFPASYDKALFFADYSRDCIWVMNAGPDGRPDPSTVRVFERGASNPVNLEVGPDGALYYPDFNGGKIWRIEHVPGNQSPVAVASADPTAGDPPLTVDFDGTGSSDPDGDPLTYAWDLDGDGQYDDSNSATPSFTYTAAGSIDVGLRVSDDEGATGNASVTISVGNTKPIAQIDGPGTDLTWKVGQQIDFLGNGSDPEEGVLPASAFDWDLILKHCPSNCHEHSVQSFDGVKSGSFPAPDHEYPSHLELRLTVTDSGGLSDTKTVRLDPKTVNVTMALAQPHFAPLSLTLNSETASAPFSRPVIEGSTNTISAPTPQVGAGGNTYDFYSWWYIGPHQTKTVKVNAATTYTAAYRKRAPAPSRPLTGIIDDFNRADGPVGPGWAQIYGPSLLVRSGQLAGPGDWAGMARGQAFGPPHEVYATLPVKPQADNHYMYLQLLDSTSATASGYEVEFDDDYWDFFRVDNGTAVRLDLPNGHDPNRIQSGDALMLAIEGDYLVFLRRRAGVWTELGRFADTRYRPASFYRAVEFSNQSSVRLDDFGGRP